MKLAQAQFSAAFEAPAPLRKLQECSRHEGVDVGKPDADGSAETDVGCGPGAAASLAGAGLSSVQPLFEYLHLFLLLFQLFALRLQLLGLSEQEIAELFEFAFDARGFRRFSGSVRLCSRIEVSLADERAAFVAPESPDPAPMAPAVAGERTRPTVRIHPKNNRIRSSIKFERWVGLET